MKSLKHILVVPFALLISFLTHTFASPAYADEIKIVDNLGLTREVKAVKTPAKVIVSFSSNIGSTQIRLVNVDGLTAEIVGQTSEAEKVVFANVEPGTWRIEFKDSRLAVQNLEIQ